MVPLVIVLIVTFCIFIASLIVFTRKEEAIEKELLNSSPCTNGYIDQVERTSKSISKGDLIFTYKVSYKYTVDDKEYLSTTYYEVNSDVLDVFPEIVQVYYKKENPKQSLVKVNLERTKIKKKETVKSVIPSIVVAILAGMILFHFFVAPLF